MSRATLLGLTFVGVGALISTAFLRIKQKVDQHPSTSVPWSEAPDYADFSSFPPTAPRDLVFLHHSVGQQWLADRGPEEPSGNRHPNGGGLRQMLKQGGYRVNEATYGSQLGEHTDLFDWLPKFNGHLDEVLRIGLQDERLPEGERNHIVLFKSCFPNSAFVSEGNEPGQTNGPDLTVSNAKATFGALLSVFERYPRTLFVFVTTPPLAPAVRDERLAKILLNRVLHRETASQQLVRQAELARQFRDWLISPTGWLAGYLLPNVVVFDYYGILTNHGTSPFLAYPSGRGDDSHPSAEGNRLASTAFLPFLNRVVHRIEVAHEHTLSTSEKVISPNPAP